MPIAATPNATVSAKSRLDRVLSLVADVRGGEGATSLLMLVNILLLLVCYSVIKTVREPLILLGGGAEVRSYAAAGQALLLMAFVPAYGWFASRVDRVKLLVGVTLFFIACIETFAVAIAARVPYVGVAFFIWVGIFNMSLVAQFWAFASDIYSEEAGKRLFPVIVIGMTGGAPLGSLVAGRLFRLGIEPQVILQVSAALLVVSMALYIWIGRRATRGGDAAKLEASGGFSLVLGSSRLRNIALLVVLLNIVNTTGEYLIARLLSAHVADLALANPGFNKQAFIGAFSADYQFWVNVLAFGLQTVVASRLVKYAGLAGALLALPVIAFGGYSLIAVGFGFSVVRFVKIAENATDYSIMNTARQLLWLPMTREEKYKAKQAIDTFFVRSGDVLSAGVVYLGTQMLKLNPSQFALGNAMLTLLWIGVALRLAGVAPMALPRLAVRRLATGAAALMVVVLLTVPMLAQEARQEQAPPGGQQERATRAVKTTRSSTTEMHAAPATFRPFQASL
jgi:ATP:ADP antiporter, AAA family